MPNPNQEMEEPLHTIRSIAQQGESIVLAEEEEELWGSIENGEPTDEEMVFQNPLRGKEDSVADTAPDSYDDLIERLRDIDVIWRCDGTPDEVNEFLRRFCQFIENEEAVMAPLEKRILATAGEG